MDATKKPQAFGLWPSQITSDWVAGAVQSFQDLILTDDYLYWSEMRPNEKGRVVIVRCLPGNPPEDILPQEFNARSRVHEYGGASFSVIGDTIIFSNASDQRLYTFKVGETPRALTAPGIRFSDVKGSPYGLIAIAESYDKAGEPENYIALVDADTGTVRPLVTGHDFFADVAISADGKQMAWIAWDHPNMAWDNSQCWVGQLSDAGITQAQQIDSSHPNQSFLKPQFALDGSLWVVCDKNNWWNIYRVLENRSLRPYFEVDGDIGGPLWVLGQQAWTFFRDEIVCTYAADGQGRLYQCQQGVPQPLDLPYTQFSQIRANARGVAFFAGAPDKASAVCWLEAGKLTVLRENRDLTLDPEDMSLPTHLTFNSGDSRQAHAYYYPPSNRQYEGLLDEKPPLIVKSHGGPTANSGSDFNADIQYWTNRGYAYVAVNYAGSSGYGRAYRQSLNGHWGIFDVEDCIAAANTLVEKGLADPKRMIITGGSAGGFTVLAALTFHNTFQMGSSLFGVSDLTALAEETHKLESRYLDNLVGPYPEAKARYLERSPLYHIEQLSVPVIFFQGEDDKVVPLSQSEACYQALKAKGINTRLWIFEGEGHGFRQAKNRQKVLDASEAFFKTLL